MTERLFVVGHPVAHSKSPAMHNAAYSALGLDWSYGFKDFAEEDGAGAFFAERDWLALNVTMPYKPHALAEADDSTRSAQLARGANVLVNWGGRVFADNTDGKGCVSYLMRCGVGFDGSRLAVCGTGPTSLSIMHAAVEAGSSSVTLLGRDEQRSREAVERYASQSFTSCVEQRVHSASYFGSGAEALADADVIIDATPLGMAPGDPAPFDTRVLTGRQAVFDVVYGHGETALLSAARSAGCRAFDGAGMLVAQAVETVWDISRVTGLFAVPPSLDLFGIMAHAAGFDL